MNKQREKMRRLLDDLRGQVVTVPWENVQAPIVLELFGTVLDADGSPLRDTTPKGMPADE